MGPAKPSNTVLSFGEISFLNRYTIAAPSVVATKIRAKPRTIMRVLDIIAILSLPRQELIIGLTGWLSIKS